MPSFPSCGVLCRKDLGLEKEWQDLSWRNGGNFIFWTNLSDLKCMQAFCRTLQLQNILWGREGRIIHEIVFRNSYEMHNALQVHVNKKFL